MKRVLSVFSLLVLVSCAPEQSAEVRRREDVTRAFQRLQNAVGHYAGYMVSEGGGITPVSIDVHVQKNPTLNGQKPVLTVGLRMGLFGGVLLASSATAYDWGKGELIASFSRDGSSSTSNGSPSSGGVAGGGGSGGPSGPAGPGGNEGGSGGSGNGSGKTSAGLELRGFIKDGTFTAGTLVGSRSGEKELVLVRDGEEFFDVHRQWLYEVVWSPTGNGPDLRAVLKLKSKPVTHPAPDTSDLAFLPGLEASLEFDSFAHTPQNALATLYDPSTATLDLQFSPVSWIRLSGVSLAMTTREALPPAGSLDRSGVVERGVSLVPIPPESIVSAEQLLAQVPPTAFLGRYFGGGRPEKAVARLELLAGSAFNTTEVPFLVFPNLRLDIEKCMGTENFEADQFKLTEVDYLRRRAIFHRVDTDNDPLTITFDSDWLQVHGKYTNPDNRSGQIPTVELRPNSEVGKKGCKVPSNSS